MHTFHWQNQTAYYKAYLVGFQGGKKKDTQMVSSGSFWNTKGLFLRLLMNLSPATSGFTTTVGCL